MRFFICFICLIVSQPTSLHAKRVALVIGNDDYAHVTKLQKAVNDARAVAATIRSIGFEVIETINANRRVFDMELNKLNAQIEAGDEVIFFFAGHGISVRGRNYLLPIDVPAIKPGQERSVTKEAFSEDEIINLLQERGVKVSLLIIDACRNNPFPKKGTRSLGRSVGLSERSTPPRNTFVMYSAGFGQEALDRLSDNDQNPNSVFTRKLLPLLKTPGLSHIRMAKRLQIEVEQLALSSANKHQQFPAFYDQVRGDFYLVPGNDITTRKDPIQNDKPVTGADEVLWMTIETSNKASDFEFYLSKFPNGKFAAVAELKIRQLKETQVAVHKLPERNDVSLSYQPGDTIKDCDMCPEMVVIPPGEFKMGSLKKNKMRENNEIPRHHVTISKSFLAGKFEVTRAQFAYFVQETGHDAGKKCSTIEGDQFKSRSNRSFRNPGFTQYDNHPVVCVNWNDAKAYVAWLSRKTGQVYRLLSEAEWEFVARANTDTHFWWGESISTSQANYDGNYRLNGPKGQFRNMTVAVDSFKANAFGLYNVHGNVFEWVEDCWHDNYHGSPKDGSAWIKGGNCNKRVLRGGSWTFKPQFLRSARRSKNFTTPRMSLIGFRVARELN